MTTEPPWRSKEGVSPRFWRPSELNMVRELYPTGGAAAVKSRLPNRSLDAIRERARALGVRRQGRKRP